MDWQKELFGCGEKPLDRLVDGYSNTSIFRKVAFIGDSLSSGEFETRVPGEKVGYYDMFEYSWGQYIARKNGLTAYNFSRGGLTAKEYVESYGEAQGFWDAEKKCQAYVIALGVNDNGKYELGNLDDIDTDDYRNNKPTFVGCYAAIVSRYKELCPDAKFFFVTLCRSEDAEADAARLDIVNAIRELAEYFDNAYVIDLFEYGPAHNKEFCERFYLHGHLAPEGYVLTAKIIDSYIDYIIRHNPDDFKQAGFIGTDIKYK